MKLKWKIACPYCGNTEKINLENYVVDVSEDERNMGTETEYTIECEEYKCEECKKIFRIEGSIWEYPQGMYNDDSISVIELEEDNGE